MKHPLYIVTPTGDRKEAFSYCIQYMERQTFRPDVWIITDDGTTDAVESLLPNIRINYDCIKLPRMEGNSLVRNLRSAFAVIPDDAYVCVIEDDDYYPKEYLDTMYTLLKTQDQVGARFHHYYNVAIRRFRVFRNSHTMCTHGLGFSRYGLSFFKNMINDTSVFCDGTQWGVDAHLGKVYDKPRGYNDTCLPVHIVGMPCGRPGTTVSHRLGPCPDPNRWKDDRNMRQLKEWVGGDYKNYERFYIC